MSFFNQVFNSYMSYFKPTLYKMGLWQLGLRWGRGDEEKCRDAAC